MRRIGIVLKGLACVLVCNVAHADMTASVEGELEYDDNIYRLQSNEVDAWITKIAPAVELRFDQGNSGYGIKLEAESGIYSQSLLGDDDYTDYGISGTAGWEFDKRNRLDLGLYHDTGHDDRGTGRQDIATKMAGLLDAETPDEWRSNSFDAEYTFGAKKSAFNLVVNASVENLDYLNNESATAVLEKTTRGITTTALIKILPRTSMLIEARGSQTDYDETLPTDRDSDEVVVYVGVEWEATAKTTGSIRTGWLDKKPEDDVTFRDFDSSAWEADVIWAPKTYSSLRFTAFRGVEDSSDALAYIDRSTYSLTWSHEWSGKLKSQVFYEYDDHEYEGVARDDNIDSWGFSADYQLAKWLQIGGEYRYEDRESSALIRDFERNVVSFSAKMELE